VRAIAPKFGLALNMNETLFDELKASAYRCKRSVLWPSKYAKMRLKPRLFSRPRWGAHDASQTL